MSEEILVDALANEGWERVNKVPGELSKLLWEGPTGASIHVVRFAKGSGIPSRHVHGSNQFMFCLEGRYRYTSSDLTLGPGYFYANPVGHPHGPTEALEDTTLIEIYDGPHFLETPDFEYGPGEARP